MGRRIPTDLRAAPEASEHDPFGRVRAEIGLGEKGIIDADLPKAGPPTLFVQFGTIVEIATLLLAAMGWLACRSFR